MTKAERETSAARTIMPIAAMFLLVPTVMLALALVSFSPQCEDWPTNDTYTDCYQENLWALVGAAVSMALAICSIVVAMRARTAENAWKGSIVPLVAAVPFSPLVGLFGA